MAKRSKSSGSLSLELADALARAAAEGGESFSGGMASTVVHRLRIDAGRRGLAEWERAHGALTPAERVEGRVRARRLLGTAAVPSSP